MDHHLQKLTDAIHEAWYEGRDVAELIAHALCHVAVIQEDGVEVGIEGVLRNRPGSWEATHVRNLMRGAVGEDGEGLDGYR